MGSLVGNRQDIKPYSLPAGRQNAGEASIRELYEGTGIRISPHMPVEYEVNFAVADIGTKDRIKRFSLKIYFCVDLSLNRQIRTIEETIPEFIPMRSVRSVRSTSPERKVSY